HRHGPSRPGPRGRRGRADARRRAQPPRRGGRRSPRSRGLSSAPPPDGPLGRNRSPTWHNKGDRVPNRRRMMNKTYAVPPPPPHNEGKTVAASTPNLGLVPGGIIITSAMVLGHMIAIAVGAVVMVVALIAGVVMSLAGLGQKRTKAQSLL